MFSLEKDERNMREIKKKLEEREWVGKEREGKFLSSFSHVSV